MRIQLSILLALISCFWWSCKSDNETTKKAPLLEKEASIPDGWQQANGEDFSLLHPEEWRKDMSGLFGTKCLLFAPENEAHPDFEVNINVMVQKLPEGDMDTKKFVDLSIEGMDNFINNATLLSNKAIKLNGIEYYEIVYTGKQNNFDLQFHQLCHVTNNKAYVITLTTEQSTYDDYKELGSKIMKTFRLLKAP